MTAPQCRQALSIYHIRPDARARLAGLARFGDLFPEEIHHRPGDRRGGVLAPGRVRQELLVLAIRQEAEQEYRKLIIFYGKRKGVAKLETAREKARQAWAARGTVS